MSKNHNKTVTENFVREMDRIIREGHAKNMTEIANECNYYIQGLSDITKGRRNVSVDLLYRFVNKYNVDANLLLKDAEKNNNTTDNNHLNPGKPPDQYLYELLKAKDNVIDAKENVINTQKELITSLKREIQPKEEGKKRKAY